MKPGTKPTPTVLRAVGGQTEGVTVPLEAMPSPPEWLLPEAKAEWKRLGPRLHKAKLLSALDRGAFAAMCQAYGTWAFAEKSIAKVREAEIKRLRELGEDEGNAAGFVSKTAAGNLVHHPLASIAAKARTEYVKICVEFGLTPSSRARIDTDSADNKAGGNAARRFLNRARG